MNLGYIFLTSEKLKSLYTCRDHDRRAYHRYPLGNCGSQFCEGKRGKSEKYLHLELKGNGWSVGQLLEKIFQDM